MGVASNGNFVILLVNWKTSIIETNLSFRAQNLFYVPVEELRSDDDIDRGPWGYDKLHPDRVLANWTVSQTHSRNSNNRPFASFKLGGVAPLSTWCCCSIPGGV